MSRLYNNEPLTNCPVHNVAWDGEWDHTSMISTAKGESPGILLEGTVSGKARLCVRGSGSKTPAKVRYYVLYSTIERAHKRKFDSQGKELEPNFSETTKVSTGYLNSSYDVKAKGKTDLLAACDVKATLESSEINKLLKTLPKGPPNTVALFMREEDLEKVELPEDAAIRAKTVGNSPFIESLVVKDETSNARGNYTGDETMGGNWTDKIMSMKAGGDDKVQEPSEIEDDEWDD